jgi:inner membrane protein
MIAAVVDVLGLWSWVVVGLALMELELLVPGVFLIWLGLAAVLTGMGAVALTPSWQVQALTFAIFSVAAVGLGRAVTCHPDEEDPTRPLLNRRGHALVGCTFTLDGPITSGAGRIRVDDSVWRVTGSDAPAGARVRVVRT